MCVDRFGTSWMVNVEQSTSAGEGSPGIEELDCGRTAAGRDDGDSRTDPLHRLLGSRLGLRTLIQLRRTGSTGFHGLGGRPGSAEWITGVGFTLALLLGAAAPVLALLDVVEPIAALDTTAAHAVGLILAVAGIAATFYAQVAMGTSWRIGVDPGERTELVTAGPFGLVRNPIFAAMLPTALGLTLLVPSWVALPGLASWVERSCLPIRGPGVRAAGLDTKARAGQPSLV